jgi:hypothetical protein
MGGVVVVVVFSLIFITAKSLKASVPVTLAVYLSPLIRVTSTTFAFSTT